MLVLRSIKAEDESVEKLREKLFKSENIEKAEIEETIKGDFSIEVVNADRLVNQSNGIVSLNGNVLVNIHLKDGMRQLYCDYLLFDNENKRITALNNIKYIDTNTASPISNIESDVITFFYETDNLILSGGVIESERKNGEGNRVSFYTTGSVLKYNAKNDGIFLEDGFISSNVDNPHSSITAQKIALLEGHDMFLINSFLKLGRVPILYLPAFFYPGSTLIGNPSFGFRSEYGMFYSSTYEILGKSPLIEDKKDESSFSTLLRADGKKEQKSYNGIYYEDKKEDFTSFESYLEKSESYLSMSFDAYQHKGLFLSYDSNLNTTSELFKADMHGGLAFSNNNYNTLARGYNELDLDLSSEIINLSFSLPYYSDPLVHKEYSNRLTTLSLDSLFNLYQTFPGNNTKIYDQYEISIKGDLKLPSRFANQYIRNLSLYDININLLQTWDTNKKEYYIKEKVSPSFKFAVEGYLLDIGKFEDVLESDEGKLNDTEKFIINDSLLRPLYESESNGKTKVLKTSFLSLKYSLSSQFKRLLKLNSVDNFYSTLDSSNRASLVFESQSEDKLYIYNSLMSSFYYNSSPTGIIDDFNLINRTRIKSDYLGLEYNLNNRLYRYRTSNNAIVKIDWFSFDRDSVVTHDISYKYDFNFDNSTLTPKLTYVLFPLTPLLSPSISFKSPVLNFALSWSFKGEDLKSDDINFSLSYDIGYFTYAMKGLYRSAIYDAGDNMLPLSLSSSLTLQNRKKDYSVSQYVSWHYYKKNIYSYFDSVLTSVKMPGLSLFLDFATLDNKLEKNYLRLEQNIKNYIFMSYKNRIGVLFNVSTKFNWDFNNIYNTYLDFNPSLLFTIREFLDLKLTLSMRNDSFYKYDSFDSLLKDFTSSFDFFSNGRYQTGFNMNSLECELIHYMQDWDLNVKYKADVVYTDSYYRWLPSFSIFLKWKTLPDLKTEEKWEYSDNSWKKIGD